MTHRSDEEVAAAKAQRADRINRMKTVLVTIAEDDGQPAPARVSAAVAYLNREEGMPGQQITTQGSGAINVTIRKFEDET